MTGLFYEKGRMYFTLAGSSDLFMRYFTVESGIVGAQRFTVTGPISGVNWADVRGTYLSGGHLYWVDTDGDLHRVNWTNGSPLPGTDIVVSGPGLDGNDWRARALFTYPGTVIPPNKPPTAEFDSSCLVLECDFDASTSDDPDGTIASYEWDFGDGDTDTGETVTHEFDAPGTYPVTLTVTDDDNAEHSVTEDVTVTDDAPPEITFVGAADGTGRQARRCTALPSQPRSQADDALVLTLSTNSPTATASDPAGWLRQDEVHTSSMSAFTWTKVAVATDAGSQVEITSSAILKSSILVAGYRGASVDDVDLATETVSRATHTTPTLTAPAGSWVVSYWTDKTAATTSWTPPAGVQTRLTGAQTGAGHMSWLLADSGAPVAAGSVGGLTATANSSTLHAAMGTVVLAPGG